MPELPYSAMCSLATLPKAWESERVFGYGLMVWGVLRRGVIGG